jgi:hypothetical protein
MGSKERKRGPLSLVRGKKLNYLALREPYVRKNEKMENSIFIRFAASPPLAS